MAADMKWLKSDKYFSTKTTYNCKEIFNYIYKMHFQINQVSFNFIGDTQ